MKYVYPALFQSSDGGYCVTFPDVEGAITCGDTLPQAVEMAHDALALMLVRMEDRGEKIKAPTPPEKVRREDGDMVMLVSADTEAYRRA